MCISKTFMTGYGRIFLWQNIFTLQKVPNTPAWLKSEEQIELYRKEWRIYQQNDYGIPGQSMDSEWEAVKVLEVKDNEHAEAGLHEHFDHLRVTDSRELFYTDDPYGLAYEAADVVDGTMITADLVEIGNLFDPLSLVALGAGITLLARTFAPENTSTKKAEKFMRDWELRTETRYKNAETPLGKFIFGSYKTIFKVNKSVIEKSTGFVEGTAVLLQLRP